MFHGFLAFGYLSAVISILAPKFFLILLEHWKWITGLSMLTILVNISMLRIRFSAFSSLSKYLPLSEENYQLLIGCTLLLLFILFVLAAALNLIDRRSDKLFITMLFLTILSVSTCFGIGHQFSSRYLMTCFPFVILMIQPFYSPSLWSGLRFLLGSLIGAATLASYYQWV